MCCILIWDVTWRRQAAPIAFAARVGQRLNYGKYGVAAVADLTAESNLKVALWGDSFGAAPHVAEHEKMAQQVTSQWRGKIDSRLGVGTGRSDRTVADYYYLLPRYEARTDFPGRVVVMGSLRDICPDEVWFLTGPLPASRDRARQQPLPALRGLLTKFRLEFI